MKELGNCFDENGRYFLDNAQANWKIVHGVVINSADKKPMGHCWIEVEYKFKTPRQQFVFVACIDKSNGNDVELPQEIYYKFGQISETKKYDIDQYRKLLIQHENWGPWELNVDR